MDLNDRHSELFECRVICVFALKKTEISVEKFSFQQNILKRIFCMFERKKPFTENAEFFLIEDNTKYRNPWHLY